MEAKIGRVEQEGVYGMMHTATDLQQVLDELAIRRVVDEVDNTVDTKDWDTCRSYFLDEIDVDFTSLAGGSPGRMKADDLVGAWRTNLYSAKPSFHMRTNHRIVINGDKAEVFSKGYAFNLLTRPHGSDLWEVWGNYRHTLQRTDDGWKVSGMALFVIYARGNEKVREYLPE